MTKRPPHPGEMLREDVLSPLGLSVTAAAGRPSMSRAALSPVPNGRAAISPDLGTVRFWMTLQADYDLAQAMRHKQPPVRVFQKTAA